MTTASDATASSLSPTPTGWWACLGTDIRSHLAQILDVFRRSPEWAIILFAWLAAAFIPTFWFMGEDHWWSQSNSPLIFEPFVPFLCATLVWQDRNRLQDAWRMTPRHKRRGLPWLLWLGCFVILVSHLMHVLTVAAIGLVLVAAGIIYLAYGPFLLKQSTRILLFALLLVPPPATAVSKVANLVSGAAWVNTVAALQRLGKDVSCAVGPDSTNIVIQGHEISALNNQFATIILTGFVLLFIAVWRRDKIGVVMLTMAFGGLLGGLFSVAVPFGALLLPSSAFSEILVRTHPLILAAVSVSISVLVRNRVSKWLSHLAERSRFIGKFYKGVNNVTDRAAAGVATRLGAGSGRVGRGVGKATEAAMDRFFAAMSKPFKRKRRNRW